MWRHTHYTLQYSRQTIYGNLLIYLVNITHKIFHVVSNGYIYLFLSFFSNDTIRLDLRDFARYLFHKSMCVCDFCLCRR